MIALMRPVSLFLTAALLMAGATAWAGEDVSASAQGQTDWSQHDAEVARGVEAYDAGKYVAAKAILLPLAETGHPKAMNIVGRMHEKSDVFPNDPKLECDWYERSAKAGYSSAMFNLSNCFYWGNGRPKDSEQERLWLLRGAETGNIHAMFALAYQDKSEGALYRGWMIKAARHGSKYALVDLWLMGYENDAWENGLTVQNLTCVIWHILILDKDTEFCD